MSPERRYSEAEIKEIFSRASAHQRETQKMSSGQGLTLSELQQIAREVGISPTSVAEAAASLEHGIEAAEPTTYLGQPVTVARTVRLPDSLSDAEWEELVVDLRQTFSASGEVRNEGSLRQWRNGNLQGLIEPDESGSRLRLQSFHEVARNQLIGGLVFLVMNLAFLAVSAAAGKFGMNGETLMLSMLAAAGLGVFGHGAYRLRTWIARRGSQMEGVAERLLDRIGSSPPAHTEQSEHAAKSGVDVERRRSILDGADRHQDEIGNRPRPRERS